MRGNNLVSRFWALKIPDKDMEALETNGTLTRPDFHGEWNYTLTPGTNDTPKTGPG